MSIASQVVILFLVVLIVIVEDWIFQHSASQRASHLT